MPSADQTSPHAELDKPVFLTATVLLATVLIAATLFPDSTDSFFASLQAGIVVNFSWYYVLVVAVVLVSVTFFAFSSYGEIKLGPDHSVPEYSFVSWFSMMFAAGEDGNFTRNNHLAGLAAGG